MRNLVRHLSLQPTIPVRIGINTVVGVMRQLRIELHRYACRRIGLIVILRRACLYTVDVRIGDD